MTTAERLSRILLIAMNLAMALLLTVSAAAQADCARRLWKEGKWSKCQQITTRGVVIDPIDGGILRDTTHTQWVRMRVVKWRYVRDDGTICTVGYGTESIEYKPCPAPSR